MKTLHFQGGATSPIKITKDGRKWCYFTACTTGCRYRIEKATGIVQVAPYWKTLLDLYVD